MKYSSSLALLLPFLAMAGMGFPGVSSREEYESDNPKNVYNKAVRWFSGLTAEAQSEFIKLPESRLNKDGKLEELDAFIKRHNYLRAIKSFIKNNPNSEFLKYKLEQVK